MDLPDDSVVDLTHSSTDDDEEYADDESVQSRFSESMYNSDYVRSMEDGTSVSSVACSDSSWSVDHVGQPLYRIVPRGAVSGTNLVYTCFILLGERQHAHTSSTVYEWSNYEIPWVGKGKRPKYYTPRFADHMNRKPTRGDGNCGYYSFIDALSVISDLPTRMQWTGAGGGGSGSWVGQLSLRWLFYNWLLGSLPVYHDKQNRFCVKMGNKKLTRETCFASGYSEGLLAGIYNDDIESANDGDFLESDYWFRHNDFLPMLALMFGVSICFYTNTHTRLLYYRDDGIVQVFNKDGFQPPIEGAVMMYWNGINHYESVRFKGDALYSPDPAVADV